ncbi:hypothetical protein B0A49_13096 [Cryomyces minteri]|uniref:Uncharacterized protein n=1 Tax=Cryomyces minteri TaxID=331657 RepID=A0A4U0WDP7_9PEZI|nr:hypothetical protein B0A49_13096 [Cryomyces minteri]
MELQGNPEEGRAGAIWEVLPVMESLLKHLEDTKRRYADLAASEDSAFLRVNSNLGWKHLNKYYTLTDETPVYLSAVVLHPAYKWRWIERKWRNRPEWVIAGKVAVEKLWQQDYRNLLVETPLLSKERKRKAWMALDDDDESLTSSPLIDEYHSWSSQPIDETDPHLETPIQYWLYRLGWPGLIIYKPEQDERPGHETAWIAVREALEEYLTLANSIIGECLEVEHIDDLAPVTEDKEKCKGHEVDSVFGISLSSGSPSSTNNSQGGNGTTLRKITRELGRIRPNRHEVKEIIHVQHGKQEKPKSKILRKTRSLGTLDDPRQSRSTLTPVGGENGSSAPAFDVDGTKMQRLVYEDNANMARRGGLV